eukprot:g9993.t1
MLNRSAAAALAAVLLLSLSTTPCAVAGRTHLRGGSTAPTDAEKRANRSSGKGIRGGGGGWRRLQATAAPTAPAAAGNTTDPPEPQCTTLFVPSMAGPLTGSYAFKGRYNNGHPVYTDSSTGNSIFYESSNFYITQPSARLFLALETDVFEPADLEGLQPWVRYNDPTCHAVCTWNMRISCTTLTADVATAATPAPAAAATAAPTTAAAVSPNAMDSNSTTSSAEAVAPTPAPTLALSNSTSSLADTSVIGGCMSLSIRNGGERAGVYVLNTNVADDAVLINGRPSYVGVGVNRTSDQVFTLIMDVCAAGYGVVDAAWAEAVNLSLNATAQAVFLMYVAERSADLGLPDNPAVCELPVWFVTSGAPEDLDAAGEYTFLSLSDVEDPSEATSWAKFTPATEAARATLVDNSWIDVGCADANEVEEALEGNEEAGTGAGSAIGAGAGGGEEGSAADVPPVGSEPNGRGRRLRGN